MEEEAIANTPLGHLRQAMKEQGAQALWIPYADIHQNEYVPPCYQRLRWLTGFSGSAGLGLVSQTEAILFVDGRYMVQAPQEIDTTLWAVGSLKTSAIQEWILKNLGEHGCITYDPWLMTIAQARQWEKWGQEQGIQFKPGPSSLIDQVWTQRPLLPKAPLASYPLAYAGEDTLTKRKRMVKMLEEQKADWAFFSQPDSIAWLLNLRGGDVPTTPIFLAFAALHKDGDVHMWIDKGKFSPQLEREFEGLILYPYNPFHIPSVFAAGTRVTLDPEGTPVALKQLLEAKGVNVLLAKDVVALPKALKNQIEQKGMRAIHQEDALALIRWLAWLEETWSSTSLTELDVVEKLHAFRCQSPLFKGESFDTIAAAGPHGAIVHYKPTAQSNRTLQKGDLLLIDSGGQYWGGTTDVTRTIPLGPPTLKQRQAFTRVLKGHIRLASARFPAGTTGSQLDSLARFDLWQAGQDYAHGTGHGVGNYLSVHEGPQRISSSPSTQALLEGMVLSNEPGYYLKDAFGIRIESLVMVQSAPFTGFLEFETLTLVPIDGRLIEKDLLTSDELDWLKRYHETICRLILPLDPHLNTYLSSSFFTF